jgi:flagellar motility protein MotE (MotC chaperone)
MSGRTYTLPLIALCFLGSALLRGELIATAAAKGDASLPSANAMSVAHPDPSGKGIGTVDTCGTGALIERLKAREASFVEREAELNARAARIEVAGERLAAMMAALEETKAALDATVSRVDGAQARDIDHLVTMYSTMKPKRAGALFDEMDVSFASELLARTKPEAAAMILSNMEAKKAFTISVLIARRNQGAPTE